MARLKPRKTTQQASKFISLERLKQIQTDNYVGENGVDYCSESVDRLIREKQTKQGDDLFNQLVNQWDEYDEFIQAEQKVLRNKGII